MNANRYLESWRDRAKCLGKSPTLWFPLQISKAVDQEYAKMVCAGCTVKKQCLDFALDTGQDSGVYGGISERDRKSMKRRAVRQRRRQKRESA